MRTLLAVLALIVAILTVLAAVALAAWLWLAVARGGFWRTDQRLPPPGDPPVRWPSVVAVVPARDEAAVLADSLPTLLAQHYPGPARVLLVDDNSTDGTAELAAALAAAPTARLPLRVLSPGEPAPGWTGKLWALRAGVAAATASAEPAPSVEPAPVGGGPLGARAGEPAEYLLLTDADIAHRPGSLTALVTAAQGHRLDLVSQMARLRTVSAAERLVVPAFVYFFALLYPFRWVNRPSARTAAAAGGCTLVRAGALAAAGGVAAIRGAVIDDVSLARGVARAGGRIWLGLADGVDSVRPYPTLRSLWRMVARSAYAQLRHNLALLAGTVLGLLVLFAVPVAAAVVGALSGRWPLAGLGAAAWLLMAATYLPMLRYYRQPAIAALALPATGLLYAAMTVQSAVAHHRGRGAAWKGRTYR
ncbi:glycosyltransferase [Actinocatenispora comari]|uniref:Glycosyl transferase family 2 n=1 Tax=Actinocatenispora comari TaxID=2807577 RepID=A0A8J4A9R8_9ACTN|nr:glycosyltransferase [Actinocatenispora comari]GIL27626.1 glycosyl transferase family 2 [Actinocatenispora comari]